MSTGQPGTRKRKLKVSIEEDEDLKTKKRKRKVSKEEEDIEEEERDRKIKKRNQLYDIWCETVWVNTRGKLSTVSSLAAWFSGRTT